MAARSFREIRDAIEGVDRVIAVVGPTRFHRSTSVTNGITPFSSPRASYRSSASEPMSSFRRSCRGRMPRASPGPISPSCPDFRAERPYPDAPRRTHQGHTPASGGSRRLLEGSVQRSANRVRVNAQLIDTADDVHLWAERFDGDASDLFALQDKITSRIAVALDLELIVDISFRPCALMSPLYTGRSCGAMSNSRP